MQPADLPYFVVCVVGVFGLFRAGELLYKPGVPVLQRRQVTWLSDCVIIHLLHSKTDYFNEGVDVKLFKADSRICPYSWLLAAWNTAPDKSPGAPLFQHASGSPIAYSFMLNWVKQRLASHLGFDPSAIGLHSFRIGGATTLAILGFPAHIIKLFGRWKSIAYLDYIRINECPDPSSNVEGWRELTPPRILADSPYLLAVHLSIDNSHVTLPGASTR